MLRTGPRSVPPSTRHCKHRHTRTTTSSPGALAATAARWLHTARPVGGKYVHLTTNARDGTTASPETEQADVLDDRTRRHDTAPHPAGNRKPAPAWVRHRGSHRSPDCRNAVHGVPRPAADSAAESGSPIRSPRPTRCSRPARCPRSARCSWSARCPRSTRCSRPTRPTRWQWRGWRRRGSGRGRARRVLTHQSRAARACRPHHCRRSSHACCH